MSILHKELINIIFEYGDDPNIIVASNKFDRKTNYSKLLTKSFGDLAKNYEIAVSSLPNINNNILDKAFTKAFILLEAFTNPELLNIQDTDALLKIISRKDLTVLDFIFDFVIEKNWRDFFINILKNSSFIDGRENLTIPKKQDRIFLFEIIPDISETFSAKDAYAVMFSLSEINKKRYYDYLELWKIEKQYKKD